jgi:hypothetical protein
MGDDGRERAASYPYPRVRGFPAPRPRAALLHIVAEDARALSQVLLLRTPFVSAGPNTPSRSAISSSARIPPLA